MSRGQELFEASRRSKICIVGFAESKRKLGEYFDDAWTRWGVNDLYCYLPKIDVVFEVHHLDNLGNRRNAEHMQSLHTGQFGLGPVAVQGGAGPADKRELPVVLLEENPNLPTAMLLPTAEIERTFQTEYFTSSVAWMVAFAILELTEVRDGIRFPKPGAEIALVGIHMAAESEYANQRPCVEYWIGVARGLGIPVSVPDEADILKSASKYGFVSSSPIAVKIQSRRLSIKEHKIQLLQQEAQLAQQLEIIRAQLNGLRAADGELANLERNYCMPTDIIPGDPRGLSEQQQKDRGVIQLEDGTMLPSIPVSDGNAPQEVLING